MKKEELIFLGAHSIFKAVVFETGSRRKAMRSSLTAVENSGFQISVSRDALRKKLARVFARLEAGATIEMALADKRSENPGRPTVHSAEDRRRIAREYDRRQRRANPERYRNRITKWRSERRRELLELSLLNVTQILKGKT